MARFPMFVDMSDRMVYVIGGGRTACRKVNTLLDFDAEIKVICASACEELLEKADNNVISLFKVNFAEDNMGELDGAFMVICASDNRKLNERIATYCIQKEIWVNCVDNASLSTFVFPSVIRRDELVVGITTSGNVPALSKHLREKIEELIPESYGDAVRKIGIEREEIKKMDLTDEEKKDRIYKMIEDMEAMGDPVNVT